MKSRRLTLENHINTVRMALAQIDEMLTGMEEILESDPVPEFDPRELYRCKDPEFHAAIHYTDREGRHFGSVWKNGDPPFTVSWDSSGRQFDVKREGRQFDVKHDPFLDLFNTDLGTPPRLEHQKAHRAGDHPEPRVPEFDPKKLYRCRDPEFHPAIHYTDADGRHHGSVWKDSNPTFTMSWNSAGRRFDRGRASDLDLLNYSPSDFPPDLDSSCGE